MSIRFRFNKGYFIIAIDLFLLELLIAVYAHDRIIRPYGGDFLVVILIYCFARSFIHASLWLTAISVLLFSVIVEILQYFDLVHRLGLHSRIALIVLGTSFEWMDLIAYTAGIATVLIIETMRTVSVSKNYNRNIN
jgi:hypothetical protein